MITLITGVPGTGKSAYAVALMLDVVYGKLSAWFWLKRRVRQWLHGILGDAVQEPGELQPRRSLFMLGVPEFKLPHTAWTVDECRQWHKLAPEGAAIIIDECQKVWRPRATGSPVPDEIKALEEHRHTGNDFFLITQKPKLLDSNVRDLVGRHVHFRDLGILGRRMYEWPEVSENLAWKSCDNKRPYKLPRHVFSLYKSASLHVKPIRGFPRMVAVGVLALAGCGFFAWKSYGAIADRLNPPAAVASAPVAPSPAAPTSRPPSSNIAARQPVPRSHLDYLRQSQPVVPNAPETAPMYDHLRLVVRMPQVQGGYCSAGFCRCFLQGGLAAPITLEACALWVHKPPFNPYALPSAPPTPGARAPSASRPASGPSA